MKITKFAQSCFLVETNNKRILVDPGYLEYEESLLNDFWNNIDIILITHKHKDHIHMEAINKILKNPKTKLYTTQEVKDAHNLNCEIIKEKDIISLDNIKIEVVGAVHGYIPPLKSGNEIKENVGYIIDDGNKRFYQTSDTICFDNEYKCDIVAVPICNHGLVMGPFEAGLFAKETGASLVIPMHYDNPKYPVDIELVKKEFDNQGINYKVLDIKESLEV